MGLAAKIKTGRLVLGAVLIESYNLQAITEST